MLTIALPQQLLFVCTCLQISLLLYYLLTFMWSRQANCGLASIVLCCIGNHPDTVWVLRQSISEWCLQNIFVEFSIYCLTYVVYLQDIYHGFMCKPDFSLLGKQPNLIWGGHPSWPLKWLIWVLLQVSSIIWTLWLSLVPWWKHFLLSIIQTEWIKSTHFLTKGRCLNCQCSV